MKKGCLLILAVVYSALSLQAQQVFHIKVEQLPDTHLDDPIFLTGNFNNWNPADESLKMQANPDGSLELTVVLEDVPSDRLEYKFTRGSWLSSECTAEGKLTAPRLAELGQDISVVVQISGWRDDFPAHTASENVHLMDAAFYMPQLDRHRKIWIYLPAGYVQSEQHYPVIYMQDGQHLFDEATSQGRIGPIEWAVDETLDAAEKPAIIVAINHQDRFEDREKEFYVHPNSLFQAPEGKQYLAFIVETLKPYVDQNYRTLPEKKYTAIAGSSLGGLISFYAGIHYPETFGIMGVFSPSIWLDEGALTRDLVSLKNADESYIQAIHTQKYYFYAGAEENRRKPDGNFVRMQDDVNRSVKLLQEVAAPDIRTTTHPSGRHGALYWREAFPDFYQWFTDQLDF